MEKDTMTAFLSPALQKKAEDVEIEDMPLNTIRDYRLYNEKARAMNKKLRICRYPIKPCPVELHPKVRVVFQRSDQPSNPLPVYKSDDKIHFDMKLYPGQTYDLPEYIFNYLQEKGYPIYKTITKPDGSTDTVLDHYAPRFALRTVYAESY